MSDARLDAHDIVARARVAAGADGRLPLGGIQTWGNFPYDGDIRLRELADVELPEPPRADVDPADCSACARPDGDFLWLDDNWRVSSNSRGRSLPLFILGTRAHFDLDELPAALQGELGPTMIRLERAIASIDGVARVHIDRWGDGAHHLHLFFYARPAGMPQLKGLFMPSWLDSLPPLPDHVAHAIEAQVAAALN
ncbi:MAG: hypothetical protein ACRDV3_13990 [Acidothermaceae bacterium]